MPTRRPAPRRAKTSVRRERTSEPGADVRLPRIAKGKRPQYFSDPAIDKLLSIALTLMEELSVTRDRLDTVERVLTRRRVLKRGEVDAWRADAAALAERAARRAAYVDRVLRTVQAELEEIRARGASPEDAVRAVES